MLWHEGNLLGAFHWSSSKMLSENKFCSHPRQHSFALFLRNWTENSSPLISRNIPTTAVFIYFSPVSGLNSNAAGSFSIMAEAGRRLVSLTSYYAPDFRYMSCLHYVQHGKSDIAQADIILPVLLELIPTQKQPLQSCGNICFQRANVEEKSHNTNWAVAAS